MGPNDNLDSGEGVDELVDYFEIRDFMQQYFKVLTVVAWHERNDGLIPEENPLLWRTYRDEFQPMSNYKKDLMFLALSATIVNLIGSVIEQEYGIE